MDLQAFLLLENYMLLYIGVPGAWQAFLTYGGCVSYRVQVQPDAASHGASDLALTLFLYNGMVTVWA